MLILPNESQFYLKFLGSGSQIIHLFFSHRNNRITFVLSFCGQPFFKKRNEWKDKIMLFDTWYNIINCREIFE